MTQDQQLNITFGALADPTRRAIMSRLALGETSVMELAKPFNMTLPAISKHLKVLENANLISRGRVAQTRPCRLNPVPLKDAGGWIEEYRKFWEQSLNRLEVYLQQLQEKEKHHDRKKTTVAEKQSQSLVITRVFDAPPSLVFQAWTDPEHLKHWQGAPRGFHVTVEKKDLRTGGSFRICMHSSEFGDKRLQGRYKEVVPPERLVFTHCWLDERGKAGQETLVTILFRDCNGKTELTLTQCGFISEASRDGHTTGWNSTLDRFEEYLAIL